MARITCIEESCAGCKVCSATCAHVYNLDFGISAACTWLDVNERPTDFTKELGLADASAELEYARKP